MVKYYQTKLDEFEEYKELIKGVSIVKWKINTDQNERRTEKKMKRTEFEICKAIFEVLFQKNLVYKSNLRKVERR